MLKKFFKIGKFRSNNSPTRNAQNINDNANSIEKVQNNNEVEQVDETHEKLDNEKNSHEEVKSMRDMKCATESKKESLGNRNTKEVKEKSSQNNDIEQENEIKKKQVVKNKVQMPFQSVKITAETVAAKTYSEISLTKNTPQENIEDTFPMFMAKGRSEEQRSAIKFLLDNFVDRTDVQNVCNMNSKMTRQMIHNQNFLKKCLNCHGRCKLCKFCQDRENEIFLIKNAMNKLNSYDNQLNFCGKCTPQVAKTKTTKKIVLSKESMETFKRIKTKLDNIRIFYPSVYTCKDNIIDQWGQNSGLTRMNPDIINAKEFPIEAFI